MVPDTFLSSATLSSMLTRFAVRLREEPDTQREVERLARIIKL